MWRFFAQGAGKSGECGGEDFDDEVVAAFAFGVGGDAEGFVEVVWKGERKFGGFECRGAAGFGAGSIVWGVEEFGLAGDFGGRLGDVLIGEAAGEDFVVGVAFLDECGDVAASAHDAQVMGDTGGGNGVAVLPDEVHGCGAFESQADGFDDAFLFRVALLHDACSPIAALFVVQ